MKTIWGLFATFQDAGAALDEFRRRGFAAEDLSAVTRPGMPQGGAPAGKTRGRDKKQGHARAAGPAQRGGSPAGPPVRLPGVRTVRVSGSPPLLASGRLASALEQAQEQPSAPAALAQEPPERQPRADAAASAGLAGVLAGLGLPESYAGNYATGVRRGQVLLAIRVPDERERDVVMLMRRYRVMQLAGQPVEDEA